MTCSRGLHAAIPVRLLVRPFVRAMREGRRQKKRDRESFYFRSSASISSEIMNPVSGKDAICVRGTATSFWRNRD